MRDAIKRKNWTQDEAAAELTRAFGEPVRQSYVSMLIVGAEPKLRRALALKKLFRIPLEAWTESVRA